MTRAGQVIDLPAAPAAKLGALGSMFHLVVENVSQRDYFTEKLLDCLLTLTLPIYWGCPNLGEYFDLQGIIHFPGDEADDPSDVAARMALAANGLTEEDYTRRLPAIYR